MKRYIFLLLALLTLSGAVAQNANRKGFFIEAGIGGTVGTTPHVALLYNGSSVVQKFAAGPAFDFLIGYRWQTASHWAFDLRGGGMASFNGLGVPAFKLMPGLRYTSGELLGNMSFYIGIAAGPAMSFRTEVENLDLPVGVEYKFKFEDDPQMGIAYLATVGLNITSHFYAGAVWDSQYIIGRVHRITTNDSVNWGMVGLQLGYRF